MRTDVSRYDSYAAARAVLDPEKVVGDILVGDISGSMDDASFEMGRTKRQVVGKALQAYIEAKQHSRPQDFVAVIGYESTATLCCPLLNVKDDCAAIIRALERLQTMPSGGTALWTGLYKALGLIASPTGYGILRRGRLRCLAYSDGYDHAPFRGGGLAKMLKARGVLIETFGVGRDPSDVDEPFLRKVATRVDGAVHYQFLGTTGAIERTFAALATGTLTVDHVEEPWTRAKH